MFLCVFSLTFFIILGTKLESKRKVIRKRKQPFKIIFSDIPSEEILPMKVHVRDVLHLYAQALVCMRVYLH